jgi:hypothetical protein
MRYSRRACTLILSACLGSVGFLPVPAHASTASGGGTYFVLPGVRSQFQLSESHVQCKIGHAAMPDGTSLQMLMFSTSIDSVSITGNTVVITGTMVSIVNLRSPKGPAVTYSETVPFTTVGIDNGTPGAGVDYFSVTVDYAPGGGQAVFFGATHVTFAGTVVTGDIVVR